MLRYGVKNRVGEMCDFGSLCGAFYKNLILCGIGDISNGWDDNAVYGL